MNCSKHVDVSFFVIIPFVFFHLFWLIDLRWNCLFNTLGRNGIRIDLLQSLPLVCMWCLSVTDIQLIQLTEVIFSISCVCFYYMCLKIFFPLFFGLLLIPPLLF